MAVPTRFMLRDLGISAVALLLFLQERQYAAALPEGTSPGIGGHVFQVVTGVACVIAVALLHEWGHLLGALAARSTVRYPARTWTPLLFDFDVRANSSKQFLAMSFGGYAGRVLGLLVIVLALPPDRLTAWVAWSGVSLGLLATLLIEAPVTWRVMRGGAPPEALLTVADPSE